MRRSRSIHRSSRIYSRGWLAALLLAALCAHPRAVRADAFEQAREVFDEAEVLYGKGSYAEAADKYAAAYRLIRSPLILFNIAQSRRLQYRSGDTDYRHLVAAKRMYERFLAEADPSETQRRLAEANLAEVNQDAIAEAKKQFAAAEKAMRLGKFEPAITGYEAAYDLSARPGILFNLAQAERKQFKVDAELDRLARAEELILAYRRESGDAVEPKVIDDILAEIREQRADYHRRREAEARSAEPAAMREARARYQRGDDARALELLAQAERIRGNPKVVVLQIYRLRGQAAARAGKQDGAIEAFKRYLALEPAADGTGLSEEAGPAFAAAKKFWQGKRPLALEHLPPGRVAPGKSVEIPVRVTSDPLGMVAHRELRYRREGIDEWETLSIGATEQAAKLPPTPMPLVGKSYRMEYYIRALDQHRGELDSLGSAKSPLAFLVTKDAIVRPTPLYKRWWVWSAAAAVVAGTVVTYVIVSDDGLPDNDVVGALGDE